jgi:hypothetical protein
MKPKKRMFCLGCKHTKMLFESQAKADNFIKFNSDAIAEQSTKVPSRSYYCSFCCGWHITSIANEEVAKARDERDEQIWDIIEQNTKGKIKVKKTIPSYVQYDMHKRDISAPETPIVRTKKVPYSSPGGVEINIKLGIISNLVTRAVNFIASVQYQSAEELIANAETEFDAITELAQKGRISSKAIDRCGESIAKLHSELCLLRRLVNNPDARAKFFETKPTTHHERHVDMMVRNLDCIERIEALFINADDDLKANNLKEVKNLCEQIHQLLKNIKGGGVSSLKSSINKRVERLYAQVRGFGDDNPSGQSFRKQVIYVIDLLQEAYKAFDDGDFTRSEDLLTTAEDMMPKCSGTVKHTLKNEIENLKTKLAQQFDPDDTSDTSANS